MSFSIFKKHTTNVVNVYRNPVWVNVRANKKFYERLAVSGGINVSGVVGLHARANARAKRIWISDKGFTRLHQETITPFFLGSNQKSAYLRAYTMDRDNQKTWITGSYEFQIGKCIIINEEGQVDIIDKNNEVVKNLQERKRERYKNLARRLKNSQYTKGISSKNWANIRHTPEMSQEDESLPATASKQSHDENLSIIPIKGSCKEDTRSISPPIRPHEDGSSLANAKGSHEKGRHSILSRKRPHGDENISTIAIQGSHEMESLSISPCKRPHKDESHSTISIKESHENKGHSVSPYKRPHEDDSSLVTPINGSHEKENHSVSSRERPHKDENRPTIPIKASNTEGNYPITPCIRSLKDTSRPTTPIKGQHEKESHLIAPNKRPYKSEGTLITPNNYSHDESLPIMQVRKPNKEEGHPLALRKKPNEDERFPTSQNKHSQTESLPITPIKGSHKAESHSITPRTCEESYSPAKKKSGSRRLVYTGPEEFV